MTIKFAAISLLATQVALYCLWAFALWDVLWIFSLGELTLIDRLSGIAFWVIISTFGVIVCNLVQLAFEG